MNHAAQIFCGTSNDPRKRFTDAQNYKNVSPKLFNFLKFKSPQKIYYLIQKFVCYSLILYKKRCSQIEPQFKVELEAYYILVHKIAVEYILAGF